MRANQEIKMLKPDGRGPLTWIESGIHGCAMASVMLCSVAELFCNYGMCVSNYWWNIIEVSLWTLGLAILIPCEVYLYLEAGRIQKHRGAQVDLTQTRQFLMMMFVVCVAFVGHLFYDHIPMCIEMWQKKEAAGIPDRDFWDGLESAMFFRTQTDNWDNWKSDWLWQLAYFSGAVWMALFLATAPRAHVKMPAKKVEAVETKKNK